MDPFQMVVAVVIIITIGVVHMVKHSNKAKVDNNVKPQLNHDQTQEIRDLKERVQILERIVTDNNKAIDLDREIESLRNT